MSLSPPVRSCDWLLLFCFHLSLLCSSIRNNKFPLAEFAPVGTGGAVSAFSLQCSYCDFIRNTITAAQGSSGGAVAVLRGGATFTECQFINNTVVVATGAAGWCYPALVVNCVRKGSIIRFNVLVL